MKGVKPVSIVSCSYKFVQCDTKELLPEPCFLSIKCLPLLAGRVLVCTIHEHSFTPRCFVESDSTDVAVRAAETERWQTSLARPCLSHWDSVRPAQWDSLGVAATRTGMGLGSKRHLICDGRGVPL